MYRIITALPISKYTLLVTFTDGAQFEYDLDPLFTRWEPFLALKTVPGLWESVQVDTGGFGISWNDDIDLSAEEIRANGSVSNRQFFVNSNHM